MTPFWKPEEEREEPMFSLDPLLMGNHEPATIKWLEGHKMQSVSSPLQVHVGHRNMQMRHKQYNEG
jgi:hypothetical protein